MINDQIPVDLITESEHEADFFNKLYTQFDEEHGQQNYIVPAYIVNQVVNPLHYKIDSHEYAYYLLGDLTNKKLLDYGAGDGWNTVCFAKAGARVNSIDISQNGVALINKKARANHVDELVTAEVQNAYKTTFQDDYFDIVYGGGILHHLDIDVAGKEISRILRPDGVAVFFEPIRETRTMDIVKTIVLWLIGKSALDVTEDEEPLTGKRINKLREYFNTVNYRYFTVISSANELLKSNSMKRFLQWVDYALINYLPGFKYLGRTAVVELRDPVKR